LPGFSVWDKELGLSGRCCQCSLHTDKISQLTISRSRCPPFMGFIGGGYIAGCGVCVGAPFQSRRKDRVFHLGQFGIASPNAKAQDRLTRFEVNLRGIGLLFKTTMRLTNGSNHCASTLTCHAMRSRMMMRIPQGPQHNSWNCPASMSVQV
jgi:hypothetical protein